MSVLSYVCAYILPFLVFILGPCIYFAFKALWELFKNKEKRDNCVLFMNTTASITWAILSYMWVDCIFL